MIVDARAGVEDAPVGSRDFDVVLAFIAGLVGSAGTRSAATARPGRQIWRETRRGELLGEVVKGDDPAAAKRAKRKAATVAEMCDAYLEAAEAGRILTRRREAKKPSTLVTDKGRIARHINPLLGRLKVSAVTRDDVESFMHAVTEGETKAWIKTGKHGLARSPAVAEPRRARWAYSERSWRSRSSASCGRITRSRNRAPQDGQRTAYRKPSTLRSVRPCGLCRKRLGRSP